MKILNQYPNYGFTEDAQVFNLKFNRQLKPYVSNLTGYYYISLRHEDGRYRPTALHRIIAKLFVPNPDNLPQVNHKDTFKLNCNFNNLEWVNNQMNIQHAYDNGLIPKGEQRYNNINPVENIHMVCELLQEGLLTNKEIESVTGVSSKTVGQIKYRKQWKDISLAYKW